MVDYSKWNNIELSDDDGEDCHPNIEKNTWIRLKREKREQEKLMAEETHKREVDELANARKRIAEIEQKLQEGSSTSDADAFRRELTKLKEREQTIAKKHADEEERKKKVVKWDKDSICHDGFSKTMINKSDGKTTTTTTGTPTGAPKEPVVVAKPPPEAVPAIATAVLTPQKEMTEEEMEAYVREMEIKAHTFAACKDYDEYYEYLRMHPELLTKETNEYLLLHVSDFIKKGQFDKSKKYCVAANIIQYSNELGPQGAQMLFHRLRDPAPKKNYRNEFERETLAYWHRVKEKILELQAQRAARKAQGLPEDPVEAERDTEEVDEEADDEEGDQEEEEFHDAKEAVPAH